MNQKALHTIYSYYDAFNRQDIDAFLSLLTDDVVHDLNQGGQEIGKEAFRHFMEKMNRCYAEQVTDLVLFTNEIADRIAAEFFIEGKYLLTDTGLPPAKGQLYRIRCGTFFSLHKDKIQRVTMYYNLQQWLAQVH